MAFQKSVVIELSNDDLLEILSEALGTIEPLDAIRATEITDLEGGDYWRVVLEPVKTKEQE